MNLMGSGLWGVGFSVVNARSKKLLKRFIATPMRKSDYLLAFMLSRLMFLVLEIAALVGFGWVMFRVGVRGSLPGPRSDHRAGRAFLCRAGAPGG